eukprot:CAMPEP_0171240396 /NCGR_PEP_ID=MMETSP0790-20130122/44483_1 /TAXON_ID=2925 /ORGANISM="Alexandrium catenella, Strain OF101" /LENGTH=148 /DNA_ID=CAMNT_0011706823 /DNA_START=74 /DNA_END=516 /DNA_ORIENTATION=+
MAQSQRSVVWPLLLLFLRPLWAIEPARRSQDAADAASGAVGREDARLAVLHDGTVQPLAALTQERAGAMRREPQNLNRAAAPGAPEDEPQPRDEDGGRPGGRLHPRHWQGEGEPRGRPAVQLYSTQRHGQPAVAQQYGPPAHPHGPQP